MAKKQIVWMISPNIGEELVCSCNKQYKIDEFLAFGYGTFGELYIVTRENERFMVKIVRSFVK